jgi:probable F420-dependent oxidoreductase
MDFGLSVPTRGPLATPEAVAAIASRAEALGFRYLAIPDHLVVPGRIASRYPYSQEGDWPGQASGECLEQLTLMAWLAAVTEEMRLLTSVMVVPHRNPVLTAKIFATIDVLTEGRAIVGVGTGWMAEEFAAIGTEPFAERGAVTDEYLRVFKCLWGESESAFEGDYARFSDIVFAPKPVQKPHPPIWVGGESGRAMGRVVELGDCWYPIGANPRSPLNTVARYVEAVGRLEARAEAAGRDPATIDRAFWANWPADTEPIEIEAGERFIFTGSAAEIAEDIRAMAAAGVNHLLFNFQRATLPETLDAMAEFAEKIRPLAES